MAEIYAKQTFTMRGGNIRVSWKPELNGVRESDNIDDKDVIDYITKDPVYSKKGKWRTVFDIISFDSDENNKKYLSFLMKNSGRMNVGNASVDSIPMSDNGRADIERANSGYSIKKIINEFPILNDSERNDALTDLKIAKEFPALRDIKNDLISRGEKKWVAEIDTIFRNEEIRKADAASRSAISELN